MATTLPAIPATTRTMLEVMLDALKLKEEKPKDVPPALPVRPSLRRRPPSRNGLHTKFKVGNDEEGFQSQDPDGVMEEKSRLDLEEFSDGINVNDGSEKMDAPLTEELYCGEAPENFVGSQSSLSSAGAVDEKIEYDDHSGYVEEEASNKDHHEARAFKLEALQSLVLKTKEELRQKEEENVTLLQQVEQCEKKWTLCEEKMKSMDEMYQKQIENLKMNLATVQKSVAANDTVKQPGKLDTAPHSPGYESKGVVYADARTPEGMTKTGLSKDADDKCNVVFHLVKEFEQKRRAFEEDVRVLTEVKSGQTASITKSIEELRKLKVRYAAWKKEYKVRLHDAKTALKKLGKSENQKPRRRWWCKKRKAR